MTVCDHRYLDHIDGLQCTREDHPGNPGGHAYQASDAPDRHTEEANPC